MASHAVTTAAAPGSRLAQQPYPPVDRSLPKRTAPVDRDRATRGAQDRKASHTQQEEQVGKSARLHTLKDLDMLQRGRLVVLSRQAVSLFFVQLKQDLGFLRRANLMDYSLLIGMARVPESVRSRTLAMRADLRYFYKDEGGIVGRAHHTDEEQQVYLYFVGIIDILQPWDVRKVSENAMKRLYQDGRGISAIRPAEYAARFEAFLQQVVVEGL
jgi:Phosphatidylinositol-4-phosphate 5-Kinase